MRAWLQRAADIVLVAAVVYLYRTLVGCGGRFERMGCLFPAFFVGPLLLLADAVYFGVCDARGHRVMVRVATIAGVPPCRSS